MILLDRTEQAHGSTKPALVTGRSKRSRRQVARRRPSVGTALKWAVLYCGAAIMLIPMYLLVVNAFKSQQSIQQAPFSVSHLTWKYLGKAFSSPDFNVVRAYAITALFVVLVDVLSILLAGPVSYVIARGQRAGHRVLLVFFILGSFVPSAVLLIPVVYVLKYLGLMNTILGFVLFATSLTLPATVFLFTAYIRTIPRQLDEAAALDGAGRIRTFWKIVFPLMRPAVATTVILNSLGVWNDFVDPHIILGPSSGLYTVTTGVYAAVSQYSTDYTVVFPNLLLAIAPALAFFVIMQRYIVGGLTAGSAKG